MFSLILEVGYREWSLTSRDSVATILALLLDIHVFRQATRLGKYQNMKDADAKQVQPAFEDRKPAVYSDAHEMNTGLQPGCSVPQGQFSYDTSYNASKIGFRA
jgi:hypothetical protein